jgi:hypothetical protein
MTRTLLMVITLLVGCATGAVVREVVAPARAQGQAGPSYEYRAVYVQEDFDAVGKRQQVLTKYGQEGWRLAAAEGISNGNTRVLYFERQLPAH